MQSKKWSAITNVKQKIQNDIKFVYPRTHHKDSSQTHQAAFLTEKRRRRRIRRKEKNIELMHQEKIYHADALS